MAKTPGCLYIAHMKDGPMIRIRLPGGAVTADQLRSIAALAGDLGNGLVDLTNRANLQIRGLHDITFDVLKTHLGGAGLLPTAAWADRIRNIVADPLDGRDPDALCDTRALVASLDAAIQARPALKSLSSEVGFVVDNGGRSGVAGLAHDIGLVAERAEGRIRFRLTLAGTPTELVASQDTAPLLAIAAARAAIALAAEAQSPLPKGLAAYGVGARTWRQPAAAAVRLALALGGPYENRVRRLIKTVPVETVVEKLEDFAEAPLERATVSGPLPTFDPSIAVVPEDRDGHVSCGLGVPVGRLDVGATRHLAALADRYGDGTLRLAPWHAVFFPSVRSDNADALLAEADRLGFVLDPAFVRIRLYACSGVEGCRGGRLHTKENGRAVFAAVAKTLGDAPLAAPLTIHVSGCIKGCAHRQQSDILALERNASYDVFENAAPGTEPPPENHRGSASAETLPDLVADLARARIDRNAAE
ncbi:precorrin-3B synthase [Rhodobium orientis]|uniref:Precorrin-3B synthase n=1 Tax=Rhodobium orientis TaxID=34017 RepID=A0A327JN40_9HYPH|nr:precorrin-3B synthase [Rhodobium orientis]MBB4303642.1 precorrin-3B synthase [Rhodobium orientis]MBK5951902.1 precorrin-3B synthase [Rhodobium orientis]RAI26754.1 precorrin-3B synthase [Rhodobium orientis]